MSAAKLACLHGEAWSLVLELRPCGPPLWRHCGARLDPGALPSLSQVRGPATFSLDAAPAMDALPVAGLGWFGPAALALRGADGAALPVAFDSCEVASKADRLALACRDSVSGIACTIAFRALPGGGLEATTAVTNDGEEPVTLDRCASAVLPLPATLDAIVSWHGRHNAEFVESREAMPAHAWLRKTRRGLPGHGGPGGAYLLGEDAGWHSGLVIACQLAWSGDARLAVERDDEGFWTLSAEAVAAPGEIVLAPGNSHETPPLLLAISQAGRNGAMAQMHGALRARLTWPGGAMRPRPVHCNSWEAVYFAHDEPRILALAEAAAAIGAERFILDDGWFAGRDHDRAGLGDWTADPRKYPAGLRPLAEKIAALGMEFGLWVEPEMINPDSDLYRAHPDWALALPGRDRPTARNQLLLDMARTDVRDHLFAALDKLLREVPIAYLKWDHNRDHAPGGGKAQVAGSYDLLRRVRAAHPAIEIESCAGGGGRIDAGIAPFTNRFWTSDNIDAVARAAMQRGFLAFMPPELMGAHVGASPSHATGRDQGLDFRAAIAAQGHFGIELDPATLDPAERARLAGWIAFWKEWRGVIHGGRCVMGAGADGLLWQAQGTGDDWLLWVVRRDHGADRRAQPVVLPFAEGRDWQVRLLRHAGRRGVLTPRAGAAFAAMRDQPQRLTGSWLARAGLPLPALAAESALIFHLKADA